MNPKNTNNSLFYLLPNTIRTCIEGGSYKAHAFKEYVTALCLLINQLDLCRQWQLAKALWEEMPEIYTGAVRHTADSIVQHSAEIIWQTLLLFTPVAPITSLNTVIYAVLVWEQNRHYSWDYSILYRYYSTRDMISSMRTWSYVVHCVRLTSCLF